MAVLQVLVLDLGFSLEYKRKAPLLPVLRLNVPVAEEQVSILLQSDSQSGIPLLYEPSLEHLQGLCGFPQGGSPL